MSSRLRDREHTLRHIAAEAASLADRLSGGYAPVADAQSDRLAAERLARWQSRAADGNREHFERRLSWLGLRPDDALRLFGRVELVGEPPAWLAVLADALEASAPDARVAVPHLPFARLLTGFVATGLRRLAPACARQFSSPLLQVFATDLFQRLILIAGPTLYLEFSVFRSAEGGATPEPGSTRLFDAFTARLLGGGLRHLLEEYATLARLLAETTMAWARNLSVLAEELEADRPDIEAAFGGGRPLGRAVAVTPSLSDRHNGGRTVTALAFDSGVKLVHKPRDLGVERAWFALLARLDAGGDDFRRLRIVTKAERGWAEMVEPTPCRDAAEVQAFYRRAGALLAVLYALEASDCFFENVIACGGHPILVDLETLMHHVVRQSADGASAEEAAGDILFDSVFRAGFLPSWDSGLDGVAVDISGLGARAGQVTPYLQRRWHLVNTDAMQLIHEPGRVDSDAHLPRLADRTMSVADHAEDVVCGFRAMYQHLMAQRSALLALGALADLGSCRVRFVFHATRIYGLLLKRLSAPRYLRAGVDRSIEIDLVSRFYLQSRDKTRFVPVVEAETAALERLDIPYFTVAADSRSLELPTGKVIEDAFEETAIGRVRRRLVSLGDADLARQCEFIRASLGMSAIAVLHDPAAGDPGEAVREPQAPPLQPDELLAAATAIAEQIARRAIVSPDGGATWIAPQMLPRTSRHELRALRMDLYGGLAGLALFFAAIEALGRDGRKLALAALAPLRRFVTKAGRLQALREGYTLGAGTGMGSLIYALVRCATALREPALLEDAQAAAAAITPEWITTDDQLDALSGTAGAMIGLLALHDAAPAAAVLDRAVLCGEHLLARGELRDGFAAWRTGQGKVLTGLSHGAAGIALALLRLAEVSADDRFRSVAAAAVAFEDSLFDAAVGNWPDLRHPAAEQRRFMNAWCHGASGIGLARLAGLAQLETPAIRRDIDAAVRAAVRAGVGPKDGLCCGNLGRAGLLQSAAGRSAEPCDGTALLLASAVVRRALRAGSYRISGSATCDFFDPSFFQGLSGIGYQLLRLAAPHALPNVLVWE